MAKYEITGLGCGTGTSYVIKKDGVYFGNMQPQCPDVNAYFKSLYPNDEVWVNGVLVSDHTQCVPNWVCETNPSTGYETDGCGNRGFNTDCNPPQQIACAAYKSQRGIGIHATQAQAIQANVDYYAGIISKACSQEIISSTNTNGSNMTIQLLISGHSDTVNVESGTEHNIQVIITPSTPGIKINIKNISPIPDQTLKTVTTDDYGEVLTSFVFENYTSSIKQVQLQAFEDWNILNSSNVVTVRINPASQSCQPKPWVCNPPPNLGGYENDSCGNNQYNPTCLPAQSQPVDVHVWRVAGAGGVDVFKNNVSLGTMAVSESSKTFTFNIGDTFKFIAKPASGWKFDKYCADAACTQRSTTSTYTGTIVSSTRNIYVYFSESAGCQPKPWACNPPPNPGGYENDSCGNNQYNPTCLPASSKKYDCVNGQCVEAANGQYPSSNCNGACASEKTSNTGTIAIIAVGAGLVAIYMLQRKKGGRK